ncbi:Skp2-like, FIST C domain, FIST domain, N-terminal isoform 1 [Hibiscus syriacus]|uniref:Skp2-like, FIST C domain, FIST domain, N-terminal isoform 1 n=1 Tax=Hibiscus syriacus TaxID=106335 RepID=A0A6A2YPW3_HIBSY|nr:Skp2-like, FIST C domain, FIST domain, N-terminal isoform 1 [Hibiscus syriacus]
MTHKYTGKKDRGWNGVSEANAELHKRNLLHDIKSCKLDFCKYCVLGKQTKVCFKTVKHTTQGILDYVHSDVWGHSTTSSLGRSREVENQTGQKIKCLRSDNGTEYTDSQFLHFCKEHGIKRHFTVRKTPQQNGVAERMNRSLNERARCLRLNAGLPKHFWTEAVNMACYPPPLSLPPTLRTGTPLALASSPTLSSPPPSPLLQEVFDKVMSEPIRSHLVIASVGPGFEFNDVLQFMVENFGSRTPIILSSVRGILGRDALTHDFREVEWTDNSDEEVHVNTGIVLTVGFVQGLKVDVIPLLRK